MRSLYAKLSVGLVLVLLIVGVVYLGLSLSFTKEYLAQADQQFNLELAETLVAEGQLVNEDRLDKAALKQTFEMYMGINPSIEIYLLDASGEILAFSADPGRVKRTTVSLEPIRRFLARPNAALVLGDDPRSDERQKPFSVTAIPTANGQPGYLYVVLRGEAYESAARVFEDRYILRAGVWIVAASLALGLLAGLGLFYLLTRRLTRLADQMDALRRSGFQRHAPFTTNKPYGADEIERLGQTYDQMAQRIRTQLNELSSRDAERRELIAQVSHDLRTPLANLHGYLETLDIRRDQLSRDQVEHYVGIALRQSDQLTALVESLFELAHLEARDVAPVIEPFAVNELIHDVAIKFRPRAHQRDIDIVVDAPSESTLALGDIRLIERVLDNLIENAIVHSGASDVVTLQVRNGTDHITIAVADRGAGIAPEVLPRIFDPFFRRSDDVARRHAGLGLAIVKKIVSLHGESVEVLSEVGTGTVFSFRLDTMVPSPVHPVPISPPTLATVS